nr:hypothetical protein [uncultured Pedobacter sp.]
MNKIDDLIIDHLKAGKTQKEIADIFVSKKIYPNSLSSIEKRLKVIKELYNASTMFHLGVILALAKVGKKTKLPD